MNLQTNKFINLLEIIFCTLMIICIIVLIWSINSVKATAPTIICIEMPQRNKTEVIESIQPNPPDKPAAAIKPRYGFTEDEIYLMTVLLSGSKYVNGDGEYDIDFENQDNNEQIALVLSVVMNRIRSNKFPNTINEVIWAPGQFSLMPKWASGLPEVSDTSLCKVRIWCEAYDAYNSCIQIIPDSHLYFYGNGVINISRERWHS